MAFFCCSPTDVPSTLSLSLRLGLQPFLDMLPVRFKGSRVRERGRTERIPSKKDRGETASKTTLLDEKTTRGLEVNEE